MTNQHPRQNQELNIFRKTVYDFARREIYPYREKWEHDRSTPKELYKKMAEMGFFGIRYHEELGGLAQNFYFTEAFCEELILGSELVGQSINIQVHMDMATPIINILGTPEQKKQFLVPDIWKRICGIQVMADDP